MSTDMVIESTHTSPMFHISDLENVIPLDIEILKRLPPRTLNSSAPTPNLSLLRPKESDKPGDMQLNTDSSVPRSYPVSTSLPLSQHKQLEMSVRSQIDDMKVTYIEQYQLREEKLKQELVDQARMHDAMLQSKETHWRAVLEEKDTQMKLVIAQHQRELADLKKRLQDKDEFYLGQMNNMEKLQQEKLHELDHQWKERVRVLQDQINSDRERYALTEKAKLETKEAALKMNYEKKLHKMTKKIETAVEHYKAKELMIQGALEEARREIVYLQTTHSAQEQCHREELILKDKRLVEIQQYIDEVNEYERLAKMWKAQSKDLANLVIHACATVEELPNELWTSSTPGLFSSVWDELRHHKTGFGRVNVDEGVRSYSEQKKDCVVANRAALAKCLRFSKVRTVVFINNAQNDYSVRLISRLFMIVCAATICANEHPLLCHELLCVLLSPRYGAYSVRVLFGIFIHNP